MLTPKKRAALQRDRLDAIEAEIERRRRAKKAATKAAADGSFKQLVDQLNEMAERLRASPDWREPSPEEKEGYRQHLEEAFQARRRSVTGSLRRRGP